MAILGTVVSINGLADLVGKVFVITDSGDKRVLQLNDTLQPGDTIVTPEGVIVELQLANGKVMQVFAEQTVTFTPELADAIPPSSGDSAIDYATIQTVIKAINEGRDIGEVLEETAAGLEGSGVGDDGHGFVDLPRIIEPLNPLVFEFESGRDEVITIEPLFSERDDQNAFSSTAAATPVQTVAGVTSDVQVEGTDLIHTVTLSNASAVDTTHAYTLADNTATGGGVDYTTPPTFSNGVTLAGGILTVPAGVT
ncbi:MAG: retention module-containing protein, partial [Methylophilaceae bacterium]